MVNNLIFKIFFRIHDVNNQHDINPNFKSVVYSKICEGYNRIIRVDIIKID
jgi:hypothetical protein